MEVKGHWNRGWWKPLIVKTLIFFILWFGDMDFLAVQKLAFQSFGKEAVMDVSYLMGGFSQVCTVPLKKVMLDKKEKGKVSYLECFLTSRAIFPGYVADLL